MDRAKKYVGALEGVFRTAPDKHEANRRSRAVLERTPHPPNHVAFVDSYTPHPPFYPSETSITYALWTSRFPVTWRDRGERIPVLQKNSAAPRGLAVGDGLARKLEAEVEEDNYVFIHPARLERFTGLLG